MFLSHILITLKCLYRLKCPLAGANKRFLINTIKNTLPSQKEQDQEREQREVSKEPEPNKSRKEEKPKKRRIHPYTPSFQSRRRVSYSPPRHRNRNQHTKDKYEKRSSKRWGEMGMCCYKPRNVIRRRTAGMLVFFQKEMLFRIDFWTELLVWEVARDSFIKRFFGTFKRRAKCSINLSVVWEQTFPSRCSFPHSTSD